MKKKENHERGIAVVNVRGVKKYCANVTLPNKKRKKAYFTFKEDARAWLDNYRKNIGIDLTDFATLSPAQLADIRLALARLPTGYSLTRCVDLVEQKYAITRDLNVCIADFLAVKNSADISTSHLKHITPRLNKLKIFKSFSKIDGNAILSAVSAIKNANGNFLTTKTKNHYLGIWREFFDWCKTRGYIKDNPFDHIHTADMPKVSASNPQYQNVEDTKKTFEIIETLYPQYAGLLALVAFGGIREAEAQRLLPQDFDFKNKRITLSKDKTKTRDNWLQEGMPSNVWDWLIAYPPSEKWARFDDNQYHRLNKYAKIPHNGLRHAFATYHLSLYRDAPKTSILMRHRSPNMLWQHYLAGLVDTDTAYNYFAIKPKS